MKKTTRRVATKSKLPPVPLPKGPKSPFAGANKKPNVLNKAIMEGKKLPSKNKKPGRYLDK